MLAVVSLLVGLLYMGQYQQALMETELKGLTRQAELFATAIGEGASIRFSRDRLELLPELAKPILIRLSRSAESRALLYDSVDGAQLLDINAQFYERGSNAGLHHPLPDWMPKALAEKWQQFHGQIRGWLLDRNLSRGLPVLPEDLSDSRQLSSINLALGGQATGQAWRGSDGGLVLTAALPVIRRNQVLGAILLTRDGDNIRMAMQAVQREIWRLCGLSLLFSLLLSLYLAFSISNPIKKLAAVADRIRANPGRKIDVPNLGFRHDEIGDLSEALRDMTEALRSRMSAIERFAADVSHELKNPLTSLRSAVETVARVTDPSRQAQLYALIQHDVKRLDRLITDIATASRLDAEMARIETSRLLLHPLLASLLDAYASLHEDGIGHARVVGDFTATPIQIAGIESRLIQVFQNLIANALSFSPPEGVVTVATRIQDGNAVITVRDDGPGIPEGKLETIFERFYSDRPEGEAFGQHSGLGLSICKQILTAHNGTITAANHLDKDGKKAGAVFTVTLPLLT